MFTQKNITDSLLGLCVGDALGVPVEFSDRESLRKNPVTNMRAYGTYRQPAGTWSDDSAMAFCLAEGLCQDYDMNVIANLFVKWYYEDYWTPYGEVFDIGIVTRKALVKIKNGISPLAAGGNTDRDNGNGALMRTLPLVFYLYDQAIASRFKIVAEVSSITHAHIRSVLGCFIYTEFALQLLKGLEKYEAYRQMQLLVNQFIQENPVCPIDELNRYYRVLENPINDYPILRIDQYPENEIYSSGYVVSTLEASLWCFLTTNTYSEAVLKAVNLGADTDTTACVTGGWRACIMARRLFPKNGCDRFQNFF
jgi:ADP-ribosyl-[dinitrogen reductase] hydrolase